MIISLPPMSLVGCLLIPILLCLTVAAAPEADLITSLPGQPSVSFKQYSGYVTVDEDAGRRFFYYFVEADEDPASKPLTLWMTGGPGCSSLGYGGFTEIGPFRATKERGMLIRNDYAWNKASNILFVDFPVGVGWSYSNRTGDIYSDDSKTARNNLAFLLNWFNEFPEYQGRDFFITGESYAGHYAPQLASLVVDYNRKKETKKPIQLKGLSVGNPILNGLIDFKESFAHFWSHGLISDRTYKGIIESCDFHINAPTSAACDKFGAEVKKEIGKLINQLDVLSDVCLPASTLQSVLSMKARNPGITKGVDVCIDDEVARYMNLPEVQRAFHANVTNLKYPWSSCSDLVNELYNQSNIDDSILVPLAKLLRAGIRVLVYSGDEDTILPFTGSEKQIHSLAKFMKMNTSITWRAWFADQQIAGFTQSYGSSLSFATVRGAAHTVPNSNPSQALVIFQSFLDGKPLPTSRQA